MWQNNVSVGLSMTEPSYRLTIILTTCVTLWFISKHTKLSWNYTRTWMKCYNKQSYVQHIHLYQLMTSNLEYFYGFCLFEWLLIGLVPRCGALSIQLNSAFLFPVRYFPAHKFLPALLTGVLLLSFTLFLNSFSIFWISTTNLSVIKSQEIQIFPSGCGIW